MNLSLKCCAFGKIFGSSSFINQQQLYRNYFLRSYRVCGVQKKFNEITHRKRDNSRWRWSTSCYHFSDISHDKKHLYSKTGTQSNNNKSNTKNDVSSTDSNAQNTTSSDTNIPEVELDFEKIGLIAKFKKMYKEYWYVLVPVHIATSVVWLGSFYYASKSGMDIVTVMQSWNFNEALIKPFRDSSLGHLAIAYLLYKVATPARYTITLGATTVTIKHLVRLGYIKPVPSRAKLMQMYQDKKDNIQTIVTEKRVALSEKKEAIMGDFQQFSDEFKDSMKTVGSVSNPIPPKLEHPTENSTSVQEKNKSYINEPCKTKESTTIKDTKKIKQ